MVCGLASFPVSPAYTLLNPPHDYFLISVWNDWFMTSCCNGCGLGLPSFPVSPIYTLLISLMMSLYSRFSDDVLSNTAVQIRAHTRVDQSPGSTDQQQLIYFEVFYKASPFSGLHGFPREIDCPKCVAPEPHTIVLWHLIHEFRLIVCTSYTNSSCCRLVYSFILWFCFIRLQKCFSACFRYALFRRYTTP